MSFSTVENRRFTTLLSITFISALINTALALFKINVGVVGYSQASIADGIHAVSDLLFDGLIIVASRLGTQLPDKEHPYGHGRIETVGTIATSSFLIFVSLGFALNTIQRILHHVHPVVSTFPVVIVSVVSIIANEILFRYTLVKSNKINSDLLRTSAWHNRNDALISLLVLLSVIGTRLGIRHLDSIGSLIISFLILYVGIKIIWKKIQELIDTAVDDQTFRSITDTIEAVSGVLAIHRLRTRLHGSNIFIDVHIQVAPDISVSEGHYISDQVQINLINNISRISDVTVHIDPENDIASMPSVNLPNRENIHRLLKTHWKNFPSFKEIRRTTLHYLDGKVYIEICLPLSAIRSEKKQLKSQYQDIVTRVQNIAKVSLYFE
ncbi:cation transporter [Coxiella endosymbiont of Amblyomma sculptum]|uniref:cation diffusion facilitator family transporter n=1 Tax=Coxiella endosymbiont of Amblyomma sculptum TaxID=2487929 RepID=UPI00132EB13F|nr:cation diffusion facilitator family transporter [Coxiella endosymbiont of Amblyomma sculptum]QHG92524.1 cation transporter [Coxiella endosymbiont of Amblyomma sculptum]